MRDFQELPDLFGGEISILDTSFEETDWTSSTRFSELFEELKDLGQQLREDWESSGSSENTFAPAGWTHSATWFNPTSWLDPISQHNAGDNAIWPKLLPTEVGPPDGAGPGGGGGGGHGGGGGGGSADPSLLATYTSGTEGSSTEYNITYNFFGTSLADWGLDGSGKDLAAAFVSAANYLTSFIGENAATGIDPDLPDIDDIVIDVTLQSIDGSGGTLASSGPEIIRGTLEDPGLPLQSSMMFDVADAVDLFDTTDPSSAYYGLGFEQNLWDDVVLHETLHALGFGTLWDLFGLSVVDDNGTHRPWDDTIDYTGVLAEAEYGGDLLIETDGGSGTAGGHWDEAAYGNELMTGLIDGGGNYLASFSVAALADLGYAIDDYDAPALESIDLSTYGGSYSDVSVLLIA
jgi:hypothetical protein